MKKITKLKCTQGCYLTSDQTFLLVIQFRQNQLRPASERVQQLQRKRFFGYAPYRKKSLKVRILPCNEILMLILLTNEVTIQSAKYCNLLVPTLWVQPPITILIVLDVVLQAVVCFDAARSCE